MRRASFGSGTPLGQQPSRSVTGQSSRSRTAGPGTVSSGSGMAEGPGSVAICPQTSSWASLGISLLLQRMLSRVEGELIVAGDIISKASDWGSDGTDAWRRAVMEMEAARIDLTVLNTEGVTTLRRPGTKGSIVDVTLATPTAACRIRDWRVLEDYTGSDTSTRRILSRRCA